MDVRLANLAYVIYTSGSTGRPKGAGNTHEALLNRLQWMQGAYGLDASDTVLQKTPFSFDVSVWEFFWPLMTGARLAVALPGDHRDPQRLCQTIIDHQVSTLHFVPSMLQAFMASAEVEQCRSVRRVVCSGEALPAVLAQQCRERLPHAGLYNLYGPTEAAIDVTHWTCGDKQGFSVPIGQPIDNLRTHILEPDLLPAARGVNGELYLAGIGLARGYHGRPALTAERFVPDPFDEQGGRLYRTGDLARYRPDGVIDYAGRIDHQVKIRGLRIELGEIEARLAEHAQVREAVVLAQDGPSGKQLVGYVVPMAAEQAEPGSEAGQRLREQLAHFLGQGLPDYMVLKAPDAARQLAGHRQRQVGAQPLAGTGFQRRQAGVCRSAHGAGAATGVDLGDGAEPAPSRYAGQLLCPGRRFDHRHPGGQPGPATGAGHCPARPVSVADH